MTTRKDVAKLAGVSVATVSNVLSNRLTVSEEKAERVRAAAKLSREYRVCTFTAKSSVSTSTTPISKLRCKTARKSAFSPASRVRKADDNR